MRNLVKVVGLATAFGLASEAVAAQAPMSGQVFQVTPYAGYLISSSIFDGPIATSVSTANAPVYGAQLGMKVAPNISLIGNIAYSTSQIRVGIPLLGGYDVGSTSMLLYDGGLELQLPTAGGAYARLAPFIQAGAGAIRYEADASILTTKATNFAGNVGLGADVNLAPGFGLRLMAKDYIGKFDFREATAIDYSGKTVHNWALSAGVRLSF